MTYGPATIHRRHPAPPDFRELGRWLLLAALALPLCAGVYYLFKKKPWIHYDENRYDRYIYEAAARHNVPPLLVKAVIWRESRFNPLARGDAGEVGLMQLMINDTSPVVGWAQETGNPIPSKTALFAPELNIEIGTWYLSQGVRQWRASRPAAVYELSLAYYNAGPKAKNWAPASPRESFDISKVPLPVTREYIPVIMERWKDVYEKDYLERQNRVASQ